MKMEINQEWLNFFSRERSKQYYQNLQKFLLEEKSKGKIIFPKQDDWLNTLSLSPSNINVIILGQDPYHGENQAHGFSFSVKEGVRLPPSLKNIFKEISQEFDITMSQNNGNLTPWVEQGVMLLNTVLTVEKSKPRSHKNKGWEVFTDEIILEISQKYSEKVFLLWGNDAIRKSNLIDKNKHLILTSPHPSPFSAHKGFLGNNHFTLANNYLLSKGKKSINWQIKD
jgi:uracil-DNA glycosylase